MLHQYQFDKPMAAGWMAILTLFVPADPLVASTMPMICPVEGTEVDRIGRNGSVSAIACDACADPDVIPRRGRVVEHTWRNALVHQQHSPRRPGTRRRNTDNAPRHPGSGSYSLRCTADRRQHCQLIRSRARGVVRVSVRPANFVADRADSDDDR